MKLTVNVDEDEFWALMVQDLTETYHSLLECSDTEGAGCVKFTLMHYLAPSEQENWIKENKG